MKYINILIFFYYQNSRHPQKPIIHVTFKLFFIPLTLEKICLSLRFLNVCQVMLVCLTRQVLLGICYA